ncbi:MAG: DUF1593 domain-containing protein [Verrucomicrobia bacterium]|nr:DUF1593 domain-containing protein [Verrucomicrobiota bacterium]
MFCAVGILAFAFPFVVVSSRAAASERLRLIVETDAGGDPDDEQSLVRLLVYANEWDIEGIIANRPVARPGENKNSERTGLGIVRAMVRAYGECQPNLAKHDARFPSAEQLLARTVAGYDDVDDGVQLVLRAVDSPDARPVWFLNWGTDNGAAESCLKRALDRVLRERGPDGYAKFKDRIRLSSYDKFGAHTTNIAPPFKLWVDTFHPEVERRRWYHRFSALTATAGGFDIGRDVRAGHGPLGAMYPTNTTHRQKEGDSMTFLYLVPNGMNNPDEPAWGSWAGRYGLNTNYPGRNYFWANAADAWNGATHRDNTLARWAADLQNDFRARMDWCVKPFAEANHAPVAKVKGELKRTARSGEKVILDARESSDPDGRRLKVEWFIYAEAGTCRVPVNIEDANSSVASFIAPRVETENSLHVILRASDDGTPSLARYQRVVVAVRP